MAALALANNDRAMALRHTELLIDTLAIHPRAGLDEPFNVYATYYRVLRAHGDTRAEVLYAAAHTHLTDYMTHIPNEQLRESFVERATPHRA